MEADLEHPFFVFGRGWSSACPEKTILRWGHFKTRVTFDLIFSPLSTRYRLPCRRLQLGDVCISLTHIQSNEPTPSTSSFSLESEDDMAAMPPPTKSLKRSPTAKSSSENASSTFSSSSSSLPTSSDSSSQLTTLERKKFRRESCQPESKTKLPENKSGGAPDQTKHPENRSKN